MIHIYIPTRGRATSSTFEALPEKHQKNTRFVCSQLDKNILAKKYPKAMFVVEPTTITGIADKRQFILEYSAKLGQTKIVMMDDDLFFAHRAPGTSKLHPSGKIGVDCLIKDIDLMLGHYPHGGVSAREGNNRCLESRTLIGRYMRILAYRPQKLMKLKVRFDRVRVMEDFDVALQLLRHGMRNFILWDYTHDQKKSGAAGGCSSWRNGKVQTEAANKLAKLHPGFVKVVEKKTKGEWGGIGNVRTDVRVSWKKTWESSQ